ncbi:MAG: hypothetical protein ACTS4V_00215 [Candidatus Hodgkinia cicadicola]
MGSNFVRAKEINQIETCFNLGNESQTSEQLLTWGLLKLFINLSSNEQVSNY